MTTVYEQPAGIWHVVVNGHELRQHCFTRESALARVTSYAPPLLKGDDR